MGDFGQDFVPKKVCSCLFCWDLLEVPLHLVQNCTFGHCGSLRHFVLAWENFLDPLKYMEVDMEKGTPRYIRLVFGVVHKSAWRISQRGRDIRWRRRVHKLSSPVSRSLCQATLGRAM